MSASNNTKNFKVKHFDGPPKIKREKRADWTIISPVEFQRVVEDDLAYIVDVREPYEVAQNFIKSKRFVNIPIGRIFDALEMSEEKFVAEFKSKKPSKEDEIVLVCLMGIRSTYALQLFHHLGYSKSKHFLGGYELLNKLCAKHKL